MGGPLEGKRIVLGVSGGIAAYKAVDVCRRLVDAGAHVVPVLTEGALKFVGRTTFDALGSEKAHTSLWEDESPIPHTRLGQTADVVLVAPATARVLGLYAHGISEDLLTNVLIATRAPVVVAPAMHTEMWEHAATRENVALLKQRGVHVVEPATGRLAGGDEGAGRLAEPADIVVAVERVLGPRDLDGLGVLVTAGGTREPIDPVRYLSNRSSGKQGHALADEAAARGADVTLVTTVDRAVAPGIDVVRVETAAEMEDAVLSRSDAADVILMAAAVADFRPKATADEKLKKADGPPEIVLEPTTDILAELGKRRRPGQTIVGFAAETQRLRDHAADKLARKGIDLIVANDVSAPDAGFAHDTNRAVILDAEGRSLDVPLSDKRDVARSVLDAVARRRSNPEP
ncbi:MAG TPA: bifunctional phosphopantothenoylcysteine decarboxylase/phosphopantothenate--cysteine ligase CoaBC [Acidimicrobiales bacterium]|nr:bifunctional phosphopantothenoylcysteine decarboxylase/phosphopantothenate--cysteine ligase CoaBC [Acidimicrobiales bacterium]